MKKARLAVILAALAGMLLGAAGGAQAAVVTVGTPTFLIDSSESCEDACTLIQTALPGTGATLASPITGTVVRWNLVNGASPFKYRLRVVTDNGGGSYTVTGSSAAETPAAAIQGFPANIPIQAGQVVGVDYEAGAPIGVGKGSEFKFVFPAVESPPADGVPFATGDDNGYAIGFNAEVLPPPMITAISRTTGSVKGDATVVIAGTDLAEVQGVNFGAKPAKSFTVDSEAQITAVAPARSAIGPVGVYVTTLAGTAASPQTFTYRGCKVPKLKRKKLKAAKRALRKRGCKLGKVRKGKGVKAKTGRVVKQWPKPRTLLAPGGRVHVKLR